VLGVLGMAKIIFFGLVLLLLALKIRDRMPKKLPRPCFKLPSFMLGTLGMAKSKKN
jgi:hypothetical protein